jgi:enoyl-CoA hydratase
LAADKGPPLVVEPEGAVRIVRLNRPEALNAADGPLHRRLADVWQELEDDNGCRVVIMTGTGRGFCAGGDLGVLERMHREPVYREQMLTEGRRIVRGMVDFPWPVISAVNGPAIGLGCSITGLSDLVLIESSAYLADPHVSVGLVAGDGGALTWPLLMGLLRAKEYLLTGERISAEVAVGLGLANRVVADGTALEEARSLASRLLRQPESALRYTKRVLNRHLARSMHDALDFALAGEFISSASPEHGAALASMAHRRQT